MRRFAYIIILITLMVWTGGCAGSGNPPASESLDELAAPGLEGQQYSKQGFSLNVLPESFVYGGKAEFELMVEPEGGRTRVEVVADAEQLKMAYLELAYDAAAIHPVACTDGSWPDAASGEVLSLAVLSLPGQVHYGALLAHPQKATGVMGRFTVATVEFAAGAQEAVRQVSAAPTSDASQVPDLAVDDGTGDISFSFYSQGDYDQNSEVNITDLTPLGANLGATGPFLATSALSVVDGDSNDEINISDITPIGANFTNTVESWNFYAGLTADYPTDASDDNGTATLLATVQYSAATGTPATDRLTYTHNIATWVPYESAWLRPAHGTDEGIASNRVDYAGPSDTTPPEWTNDPNGIGVVKVLPLSGGARVMWGEALDVDDESPPVTYTVYYNEGTTVDFETASTAEVVASTPPDPTVDQVTEINDLTNDTEYAFAVRAKDAATTPNEEDNAVTMTTTPRAWQIMPVTVDEATTWEGGPVEVPVGHSVLIETDECITIPSDLRVEGTILSQSDGLCLIIEGDLYVSGEIRLELPDVAPPPEANNNCGSLVLVVKGNLETTETSVITGNGNIYIVDDPDEVIDPEDVEDEVDNGDPEEFPFTWMPEEPTDTASKGGSRYAPPRQTSRDVYYGPYTVYRVSGNWGKVPVQPPDVHRVILRIVQVNGSLDFQNFSIEGPDGRPGDDDVSCNAHGGDGQDNRWRFRMHCGRNITYNNVNIKLGDGGRGGNASTPQDCDPGTAVGGNGGDALNKFRFTAGSGINIAGTFNFNPGNGGVGGTATAYGKKGEDGCPAEDGADAYATGGDGGNVPRWGVRTWGNVMGTGNLALGIAEGGVGGTGTAWAGDGGNDTCCPGEAGGDGGFGSGIGGNGGDSTFTDGGSGASGGGATGGNGGAGRGAGGSGGDGASWDKIPGGNGGNGGDGAGVGGEGGEATGDGTLTQGERGAGEAVGGNGGNGGDGLPPGVGGEGGTATADGNPVTEVDGIPGQDGDQTPLQLSEEIILLFSTLTPGPVIPGDYVCPLYDRHTETEVGEITVTLYGSGTFMVLDYPVEGTVLQMSGECYVDIDRSTADYDGSPATEPWVALEVTTLNVNNGTFGLSGAGYWYDGQMLNEGPFTEHMDATPTTDTIWVDPDTFSEFFTIAPGFPPQWDVGEAYTLGDATIEIIEIVVIDP